MTEQIEQRSPEWFAARKGKITASVVGAIMGSSPYMSRDDVMRMMVREHFGAEREFTGNIATAYGENNEENAIYEFAIESGTTPQKIGFASKGIFGASPDFIVEICGETHVGEAKCPYSLRDVKNKNRIFKPLSAQMHYYAQVQMQMHVIDAVNAVFIQWAPEMPLHIEYVDRDQEFIDAMLAECTVFYAKFQEILSGDCSEYLEPKRRVIETIHAQRLVDEYLDLKQIEDNAKARMQDIVDELKIIANEKDADICGMKLTKVARSGTVSYQKIVKEHLPDIDLEKYRGKPSEYWRFS